MFSSLKTMLTEHSKLSDHLREICFLLMEQIGSALLSASASTDRRVFHFWKMTHSEGMLSDNRTGMMENDHLPMARWAHCDNSMAVLAGITKTLFL